MCLKAFRCRNGIEYCGVFFFSLPCFWNISSYGRRFLVLLKTDRLGTFDLANKTRIEIENNNNNNIDNNWKKNHKPKSMISYSTIRSQWCHKFIFLDIPHWYSDTRPSLFRKKFSLLLLLLFLVIGCSRHWMFAIYHIFRCVCLCLCLAFYNLRVRLGMMEIHNGEFTCSVT